MKAPQAGQQLHPTIITSEGFAVVSDTEQEVTYPHPFLALPSMESVVVPASAVEVDTARTPDVVRSKSNAQITTLRKPLGDDLDNRRLQVETPLLILSCIF